ncbi:unnamed protein product, partial [Medioppia subpectinata]
MTITPSPTDNRRARSKTPEHWRRAQSKLVSLKEIIARNERVQNRGSDRNRFERENPFRQRQFNRNRDYDSRDYEREDSENENSFYRNSTDRKRVFTEEPPIRRRRRSPSPREHRNRNNDEFYAESDSGSEKHTENGRHLIKSTVKVNEDIHRNQRERQNSEEAYDRSRRNKSPVDLKDIPLPNADNTDFDKRNNERHERMHDSEPRSDLKRKRSDSRERIDSHKNA